AEVQGRRKIRHRAAPRIDRGPERDLDEVQQDDPDGDEDEEQRVGPKLLSGRRHLAQPPEGPCDPRGVDDNAQGHDTASNDESREHLAKKPSNPASILARQYNGGWSSIQ